MTQERKELLLKDLCARLPYGVKCKVSYNSGVINDVDATLYGMDKDGFLMFDEISGNHREFLCKPYLFPLSSITEEQRYEISSGLQNIHTEHPPFGKIENSGSDNCLECVTMASTWLIEYYNKNQLDYNGLINKGLAIDATGLNIY